MLSCCFVPHCPRRRDFGTVGPSNPHFTLLRFFFNLTSDGHCLLAALLTCKQTLCFAETARKQCCNWSERQISWRQICSHGQNKHWNDMNSSLVDYCQFIQNGLSCWDLGIIGLSVSTLHLLPFSSCMQKTKLCSRSETNSRMKCSQINPAGEKNKSEIGQPASDVRRCLWHQTIIVYSQLCLHINKRCGSLKRHANSVMISRSG